MKKRGGSRPSIEFADYCRDAARRLRVLQQKFLHGSPEYPALSTMKKAVDPLVMNLIFPLGAEAVCLIQHRAALEALENGHELATALERVSAAGTSLLVSILCKLRMERSWSTTRMQTDMLKIIVAGGEVVKYVKEANGPKTERHAF